MSGEGGGTIELQLEDNSTFLRVNQRRSREQRKEESCVEIENQQFFFLIKNNVCPNDENSVYDSQSNKMLLIGRNGRSLENGVMVGRLLHILRKHAVVNAKWEDFPVLDPVLGNMTDTTDKSWVHFNWGLIQREIKKFGGEFSNSVKDLILKKNHEILREIIKFLMAFER
jgi:hypothetical protein